MLLKLLTPYVGRENGGNVIQTGEVFDFDAATAAMLVSDRRAISLEVAPGEGADPAPEPVVVIDRADGIDAGEASDAGAVLAQRAAEVAAEPEPEPASKKRRK